MAGKYGVKETKEMLDLGFALAKAGKEALADGKVNLLDLGVVMPVFPIVGTAVEGAPLVPLELGEIDEADSAELLAYAKAKLPEVVDEAELRHKVYVYVKAGLAVAEAVAVTRG
jgi:hypothetical protein